MNHILIVDGIINNLVCNNELEIANEIQELKDFSCNSTELLMTIAHRLNGIIEN